MTTSFHFDIFFKFSAGEGYLCRGMHRYQNLQEQFSPSAHLVLGSELRSAGLVESAFTYRAASPSQFGYFLIAYLPYSESGKVHLFPPACSYSDNTVSPVTGRGLVMALRYFRLNFVTQ